MRREKVQEAGAAQGPLAGLRVVDLTSNVLGPSCTQILGDMGADVIKVEAPEGDTTRHIGLARNPAMGSYFLNLNRNKRSAVLDLKQPKARAALLKLIETADVFVHSIRFGAAERLGIGYAAVGARNPRLVYASAGGYRQDSSRRDWPAYDDVIQGVSGLAAMNKQGGEPRYIPMVICDKLCGQILASAIGMALYARERTGKGQEVHVAMMDAMVGFMLLEHLQGGVLGDFSRGLGYSRTLSPHRRPYRTQDGYISVLAATDAQFRRLFAALDRPELAEDPRFVDIAARDRNIDALYEILTQEIERHTTAEWRARFEAADLPNGEVNAMDDLLDHPYLAEGGFFGKVEHPTEGRFVTMSAFPQFSLTKPSIRRLPAGLGEHTREVLAEAGLSAAEIDKLTVQRR
jgi:crotonobetainyl-CoA:carnitine CoA-transferase CaiB-like acyl-CoA transferase